MSMVGIILMGEPLTSSSSTFNVGIVSFGDSVSYELVRPILDSCSADNLRRLEDATPVSRSYSIPFFLVDAVT